MEEGEKYSTDPELVALLGRFRPVDPPAALRDRIVGGSPQPGAWRWGLAAAALLVLALGLPAWSARLAHAALPSAAADDAVHTLADLLGGDAQARQTAAFMIMTEQMRAARDAAHRDGSIVLVQP